MRLGLKTGAKGKGRMMSKESFTRKVKRYVPGREAQDATTNPGETQMGK